MQNFIKWSELQVANSPAKSVKINVLETGIDLAIAEIGVASNSYTYQSLKEETKSATNVWFQEGMLCSVGNNCFQNRRKKSTIIQHCQEAGKFWY